MNVSLRKLARAIYRDFFFENFDIFDNIVQNIDSGYTLELPQRGEYPQSIFLIKNEKFGIPLYTPVLLYISGVQGGVYITRTCFRYVMEIL